MKKIYFFIVSFFMLFTAISNVTATPDFIGDGFDIDIKPETPVKPGVNPLSLVDDIDAYYFAGALTLSVNVDLGVADIYVTNLTYGGEWSESIHGVGSAIMGVGYGSGYYIVEVYTEQGSYSGSFTL